jgi:hypothetical protein
VAGRTAHEQPAHRPLLADPERAVAPVTLGREEVGQVRTVSFARVDDGPAAVAEGGQHGPGRLDRAAQVRDVIAEGLAEATGLDEVPLEIHADHGDVRRVERVREGFRRNVDHLRSSAASARGA